MDDRRTLIYLPISILSLFLLLLVASYLGFDLASAGSLILSVDPLYLTILALITAVELVLKTIRFKYSFKHNTQFSPLLHSYFFSVFVSFLVPVRVAGEGVRPLVFKSLDGIDYKQSLSAVSIERIMDMLFLPLTFATTLTLAVHPAIPILVFIFFCVLLALARTDLLKTLSRHIPHEKISSFIEGTLTELQRVVSDGRRLATISILTITIWVLASIRFWLIIQLVGGNLSLLEASSASAFAYIFSLLSILPGGLVAFEGGGVGVLLYLGLGQTQAISAIMLERIFTYWLFIIGGVAMLPHLKFRQ